MGRARGSPGPRWGAWLPLRFSAFTSVPRPRLCRGSARLCCSPWAVAAPRPPARTPYGPKDSAATSAVSVSPPPRPSNALQAGFPPLLGSAALTCPPVAGAIVSLTHDPTFDLERYRARLLDLFLKQVRKSHGGCGLLTAELLSPSAGGQSPGQPPPSAAPVPGPAGGCVQGAARRPHRDPGGAGGDPAGDRRGGAAGPRAPSGRGGTR